MTKISKQKVLVSAFLVAIMCIFLCVTASGAEITPTASGSCGDNATWEYYASTGELKILGSGAMENYDTYSSVPWYSYRADIKSITMAETVTTIGDYAFFGCSSLTSFEIPSNVTRIGGYAFAKCSSLKSLEIPSKVTKIRNHLVYLCTSLESITVESGNTAFKSIDGNLYSYDGTELVQYASGKTDKSFTVPDGVTSIFVGAFGSAPLEYIIIPDSVTSIGPASFYYCTSLKSVTLLSDTPVTIGFEAFTHSSVEAIYVPASALDAYKSSENWAEYKDIIFPLENNGGIISIGEGKAQIGKTAIITLSIENNPGIAVASITLNYDKTALVLTKVENGEVFPTLDNGRNLLWSGDENSEEDGVLATLTFEVSENAAVKDYIISAVINEAVDENYGTPVLTVSGGKITVYDILYGDADGSGKVDLTDVLMLRKYMANYNYNTGTSTIAVQPGADANGNGKVDLTDVLMLRKYMANYNYNTNSSTVVLGPPNTEPPVTTAPSTSAAPVTTAPITTATATTAPAPKVIPYKADISIELNDADGDGVYTADSIFSSENTYKYVELGAGYAGTGIVDSSLKINKIDTTVSYAWDGEYIYGYVVAKDPTLLAVGEDMANDAYNNWSYDGFELWYKLGGTAPVREADVDQFWVSLNGYALTAQTATKSMLFDYIEWDCAVNRDTNTAYITFKMLAKTEAGVALKGGDSFYTAIQMDDLRDATDTKAFYCSTSNHKSYTEGYDEYVLADAPALPVTTVPVTTTVPVSNVIPYKADISIELKDTDGDGVYTADDIFSPANTYKYVELGAGYAGTGIVDPSLKVNKIEATVSYAWDGEYIYGYVVAKDPTLLAVGENVANDAYNNWSYDGFELWYKLGGTAPVKKADVDQFWVSLNGYALTAQTATESIHFDGIEWDCVVNRRTNTSYITFKMPAKTENGVYLTGGDSFYTAIQLDDLRDPDNLNSFYCSTSNPLNYAEGYNEYVLAEAPNAPAPKVIPYKADISIELKDTDGDGVYTADEVFGAANTYAFVEKGAGLSKNISSDGDKVNKIETTVSYAWDGEYIYGYVVAKDPTLLAVGEDVADDPYKNWSYDGFELWYKLGGSNVSTNQFWASLNGYALNAQTEVKSAHFDKIEWDCEVNRDTNTTYLTFKILAKTEAGVALEGGNSFYTAIQMDDRRSAQSEVYYCATYNQAKGHFDRYVLAEAPEAPVTTVPAEVSYTIPYKTDISIELKDTDGDGVYTADEVFAAANTYAFVEKGAGLAKNISSAADKVNKIETTVSYAWDGEYIYGYVVAKDPTLLAVGEDIADDPYNNWSYDGFEFWYKLGESSASVKQFWASLNGYALNAQTAVKSTYFDKIEWDCALNRETNTSYLTFKILAKTEAGVALEGGDYFYTAIQMDDRRSAQSEVYYCATYNQAKGHFDRFVLAEESVPPVTQPLQLD